MTDVDVIITVSTVWLVMGILVWAIVERKR